MKNRVVHIGSLNRLKRNGEKRYSSLHCHVFPGVIARIRQSNIRNYSIFLLDGVLFSHIEYVGSDYDSDMKAMAEDETTQRWWKLTEPLQNPYPSRSSGEWWARMELVTRSRKVKRPGRKTMRFCFCSNVQRDNDGAIKNLSRSLGRTLKTNIVRDNVQQYCVFLGFTRLCLYVECDVEDFAGKNDPLVGQLLNCGLNGSAKMGTLTRWKLMKEVFHTN